MNLSYLQQFLFTANKAGYAFGDESKRIKESDGSTSIRFEQGDFSLHDNYFGGEPYGGRMVVFFKGKPEWIMVYYGLVVPSVKAESVYMILRNALKQMPEEMPLRGPEAYQHEDYQYQNTWKGLLERYSGEEKILKNGELVYHANYLGGLIDRGE